MTSTTPCNRHYFYRLRTCNCLFQCPPYLCESLILKSRLGYKLAQCEAKLLLKRQGMQIYTVQLLRNIRQASDQQIESGRSEEEEEKEIEKIFLESKKSQILHWFILFSVWKEKTCKVCCMSNIGADLGVVFLFYVHPNGPIPKSKGQGVYNIFAFGSVWCTSSCLSHKIYNNHVILRIHALPNTKSLPVTQIQTVSHFSLYFSLPLSFFSLNLISLP